MTRTTSTFLALILSAVLMVGCMMQPVDSVTGEKLGAPITAAEASTRPATTNPATGNPVSYRPTREPDADAVAKGGQAAAEGMLPTPVGYIVSAAIGAAAVAYGRRKRGTPPNGR